MPTDTQIHSTQVEPAPLDYPVPLNAELLLKAVNATFTDNGAGGDWLPCLTLISDAGSVIARAVDQGVKVTAGSDAEVSWFPGVKNGAAATLPQLNQSVLELGTQVNQTIHSGAVTAIVFGQGVSGPGYGDAFGPTPGTANPQTFHAFATVVATLIVDWPAGAYDRYIEYAVSPAFTTFLTKNARVRNGETPDGDRQTLTAVFVGGSGDPTTVTAQVFQASGSDKAISATWDLHTIPYGVAPYVLP